MKHINKVGIWLLVAMCMSCGKNFLKEKPLDFESSDEAFTTLSDFQASVYDLYNLTRSEFFTDQSFMDYLEGTDMIFNGEGKGGDRMGDYAVALNPTGSAALTHWTNLYKIVSEANTILSRLPSSKVAATDQPKIEADAMFFRALAYRSLAYLYGDVPLVLTEVTSPKTDFVRAPKADVYKQAIADLTFAATTLPDISAVQDGEISNLAADHLLAEVYLANGQYDSSIIAASIVINNPNMAFMTNRFGTRTNIPADVYWDLFQRGNQNRSTGNKEGIWVMQFEADVPGGGELSTAAEGYMLEYYTVPWFGGYTVNGEHPFLWPTNDFTEGGVGIGWGITTAYFSDTIWKSDFTTDMRNSNYNFVRVWTYNNPATPDYYGQTVATENPPPGVTAPSRSFYPYQGKSTTPADHPANELTSGGGLALFGGPTYADQYMFRLSETYLIRAEAHLGAGDKVSAASDINTVRARANASPVASANVTIDYILDERLRELGVEEKRRLTLGRLGMVYSRTVLDNPYNAGDIQPFNNLFPIPASEIERNIGAKLTQNPGY
jgi:starch-binding outer membrane protein, SusD/RagB family